MVLPRLIRSAFPQPCSQVYMHNRRQFAKDKLKYNFSTHQQRKYLSVQREYLSVPEFFKGRTVFITGGTGFVGQCLVEKILRSCPDVEQIILPIRVSRKGSVEKRFQEFLQQRVFERLFSANKNFKQKLFPIQVDLARIDLGLPEDVYNCFTSRVSVGIHAAANTKLNAPLREMMHDNLLGTDNVMKFAKQCPNLKACVYVSTAYSGAHLDFIEEAVLRDGTISVRDMLKLARSDKQDDDSQRTTDLQGSPITYVFSKRITEQLLSERHAELPLVISRPCMITAALVEPFPMWKYGLSAYNGIIGMMADRMLPYFPGDPTVELELIPVDIAVNSIITSAWMLGTGRRLHTSTEGPIVISLHSTDHNKITNGYLIELVNDYYRKVDESSYRMRLVQSTFVFKMLSLVRLLPTSLLRDLSSVPRGQRISNTKLLLLQLSQIQLMSISTFRNSRREYKHNIQLTAQLSETDQRLFNTDIRAVEWRSYIYKWLESCKRRAT